LIAITHDSLKRQTSEILAKIITMAPTPAAVIKWLLLMCLATLLLCSSVSGRPPQFDSSGKGYKRTILLPASVPVFQPDGTPIFRLLVYDYDQATPLRFSLRGAYSSPVLSLVQSRGVPQRLEIFGTVYRTVTLSILPYSKVTLKDE
jgi:hypothetical protein